MELSDQNGPSQFNGWKIDAIYFARLSEYEKQFFTNEFCGFRTLEYYKCRVGQLGFVERHSVLDLACGMGQWSVALGELNENVYGVDSNQSRINFAKSLAGWHETNNCDFRVGSMEQLPFPDATFDGVFCYGAFMFADMPRAIAEICRVTKPGALLYLNVNTVGWYLHLLFDRGIRMRNWAMVSTALKMLWRGFIVDRGWSIANTQMMVTRGYIERLVRHSGFRILSEGTEGSIGRERPGSEQPAYRGTYYGFVSILEFVLIRV